MTTTSLPRPADVLLADGRIAAIRPMVAADRDGLMALHDAAGDESLRHALLRTQPRCRPHATSTIWSSHSGDTVATLVATVPAGSWRWPPRSGWRRTSPRWPSSWPTRSTGHGLGSLLLEHLAAACRDIGVAGFVADVLPENSAMIRVFRDAGFDAVPTAASPAWSSSR